MGRSDGERWLSLGEAARSLGVHPATLRRWADQNQITAHLTPGGHRRFTRQELETFALRRSNSPVTPAVERLLANEALNHTRQAIAAHSNDRWLSGTSEDDRRQKRSLGQRLIGLLRQYSSSNDGTEAEQLLEEVRSIAREHARLAIAGGTSLSVALQASHFFRDKLADVAIEVGESARLGAPARSRLHSRINQVLSEFELALAETYEAAPNLSKLTGHPSGK